MPETAPPQTATGAPLTVTDEAATNLREQIAALDEDVDAIRLIVQAGGCCGLQYALALAQGGPSEIETSFESGGITFYLDSDVVHAVEGSVMELVEVPGGTAFRISNPNAKGACGC